MTQPNKPAALDAVAWMYGAEREEPFASFKRWPAGVVDAQCWTETPLTDLNKAQERIDRLEERVANLRNGLLQAKAAARYVPVGDGYFDPYANHVEAVDGAVDAALKEDEQ